MTKLLFLAICTIIITAFTAPVSAHDSSGVRTSAEWLNPSSSYTVSPEDTPATLAAGGKSAGEFLKDVNEDIGKAVRSVTAFVKEI